MLSALLTGLAGGIHCIGMCGGFAMAVHSRRTPGGLVAYHAGRLTTYAFLGAIAGTVGSGLLSLRWAGVGVATALLFWFCLQLAGVRLPTPMRGSRVHAALAGIANAVRPLGAFGTGLSSALLPCGLVYAALALPMVAGSPALGALSMVAFGLGTVPLLSGIVLMPVNRLRSPGLKKALAVGIFITGTWTVVHRLPQPDSEVPDCCATIYDEV
jgi:hypothetical protein